MIGFSRGDAPPSTTRALRKLFLTLFLRGRGSRAMMGTRGPTTIAKRLGVTLGFYAFFGLFVLSMGRQSVFITSIFLHATTFIFLGMFVATSAGEALFNNEEADILLHRPILPETLLWSKISVLVQVSLWLAAAYNIGGFIAGVRATDGGWWFAPVHAASIVLEALFCTAIVVLMYQMCLRWFGREKLDAFMTATQVIVAITFVIAAQLMPQVMMRLEDTTFVRTDTWWMFLLPPAWFAGIDDALAGSGALSSRLLALTGIGVTALATWTAFKRLAGTYQDGLQAMGEARQVRKPSVRRGPAQAGVEGRRRFLERLVSVPPLSWLLRDPVSRASFLLTTAYLIRDRDMKMRVYPGIAPLMVLPVIMLLPDGDGEMRGAGFSAAFAGTYFALVPVIVHRMVELSQHWQASDLFRYVPVHGPAELSRGARHAILLVISLPTLLIVGGLVAVLAEVSSLPLLLPGLISLPVYSLIPCLGGRGVPMTRPTEEAKAASRGVSMIGIIVVALVLAGLATWARSTGYFWQFLGVELIVVSVVYLLMQRLVKGARWDSIE